MKRTLPLTLALLLIAVAAVAAPIRIGLMAPITGTWSREGREMSQVVSLLAAEVNAAGGIMGKRVDVVVEDDGSNPRTAALAAQRLTKADVVAVVGSYGSVTTEAAQALLDEVPLVQIANGATAVRLTEKGLQYFLRTSPRDDEQARIAAQILKKQGFARVALLRDASRQAKDLADETRRLLTSMGVKVVFDAALVPSERDYSALLTSMRGTDPQAVFFTGAYPEAALLLQQKVKLGWDVPFWGGDASNNPELVAIAGTQAAAGFSFFRPPMPQDLPNPRAKAFIAAYTAHYGAAPDSLWAVLAGDGFLAVVAAIKATKSTETAKISAWLKKGDTVIAGLTGAISFNAKGDRVGEVYKVYQVATDGTFALQP